MKEKKEATIHFFAADCMEFVDYGRCIETKTIAEAVAAYKKICRSDKGWGSGIGFILHDSRIPDYSDTKWPLYMGGIAQDQIDLIPAYKNHLLVKQAVREIEQYLPELSKPVTKPIRTKIERER